MTPITWHKRQRGETFTHILLTRFNVGIYDQSKKDIDGRRMGGHNAAEWMEHRLWLFESICAPSMRAQSSQAFVWLVCCDKLTSPQTLQRIKDCHPNIVILLMGGGSSEKVDLAAVRKYISQHVGTAKQVITTRMDNDDAFHPSFITRVQQIVPDTARGTICFKNYIVLYLLLRRAHPASVTSNNFISMVEPAQSELHTVWQHDHHFHMEKHYPAVNIDNAEPMELLVVHGRNMTNGGPHKKPDNIGEPFSDWGQFNIDIQNIEREENIMTEAVKICGELDFHFYDGAVAYLKRALGTMDGGAAIFVTFNDMDKLGAKWALDPVNQKNSKGRKRLTFWTPKMMTQALTAAGFMQPLVTGLHVGGPHHKGVSTVTALKMAPVVVEEPTPIVVEEPEFKPIKKKNQSKR